MNVVLKVKLQKSYSEAASYNVQFNTTLILEMGHSSHGWHCSALC